MPLNKQATAKAGKACAALPADVKAALQAAVLRFGSQTKVGEELSVSGAAVSLLLADKYSGNVEVMANRIRGQFMAETVRCPVMGDLSKRSCLDNQALPQAFTNPMRAALGRACKNCIHRKAL
ncbi:MAG: hypothetical protein B7Y42_00400 [Polaromonas sp. 28-63-22]|jgi:fructose 1,6-bisphosphatase|nr:MAG: hypothetical protein B7Y42_00400 [Polaromonas sp. 28-63-22]